MADANKTPATETLTGSYLCPVYEERVTLCAEFVADARPQGLVRTGRAMIGGEARRVSILPSGAVIPSGRWKFHYPCLELRAVAR